MTPQLAIAGELTYTDGAPVGGGWNLEQYHHTVNEAVARTMAAAVKGLPKTGWPAEPRALAFGTPASVPGVKCASVGSTEAQLTNRGFRYVKQAQAVNSSCPPGSVAALDPSGVSTQGAIIAMYISNGTAPPPPPGPPGGPPSPGPGPVPPGGPGPGPGPGHGFGAQ
jgi:hypothetical protein